MTLTRNRRTAALLAAGTLPLAFVVLPDASGTAAAAASFTMKETPLTFRFVDLPPKSASEQAPPSIGDQIIFTSKLTRDGAPYGRLQALCSVTQKGGQNGPLLLCAGVFNTPDGQITVQTGGHFENEKTVVIAITGGTGDFSSAAGTITSVTKKDGTSIDTVDLE
jgi:hypothetical protein